ncbi:hypothetical protein [Neobacillus vireti]|uniref:HTH luxR-type domain-containing protein n=1 Tax=Neobacillus vireti LMG 21834 TaxID=1131730 RepID=A0AB94IM27_9BACI|nr:hypothetical protein [Neobacillus vireti]ETI68125.1 hypothetical protein BAVI_14019 [Neobacillus vireti LMG 21834]KLT15916.1 hypothetical protein AA980_22240 [Neobacillus vireti]
MKVLKDYIVEYKNASDDEQRDLVLRGLFTTEIVLEKNNNGEMDKIYYLKFTDRALQSTYKNIIKKFYWIDRKDLDTYVIKSIQELFNSTKVDLSRTPNEIIAWFNKGLNGRVQNQVTAEKDKTEKNLPEHQVLHDNDGNVEYSSLYDEVANDRYIKPNDINLFDKFIKSIGGLKNILSETQFEIYCQMQTGKTQERIAQELNCTQENIHKHIKALTKRIKKEYLNFRTYRALKNPLNTYDTIKSFINTYNNIIQFDINDQFDYFGYIIKFLQDNYQVGEQEIHNEKKMNLAQNPLTVLDVLLDSLKRNEHDLFRRVLNELIYNENGLILSEIEKDKVRNTVLRAFNTYLEEVSKNIRQINSNIVDKFGEEKYDEFIDLVV